MAIKDDDDDKAIELVHPQQDGFRQKITPKIPGDEFLMLKCAKELPATSEDTVMKAVCNGVHYRHAGYIHILLPRT